MSLSQQIDQLWNDFALAIARAYKAECGGSNKRSQALRDYVPDLSWNNALEGLLQRETVNERQHRRTRNSPKGFSAYTAAKLILMNAADSGSKLAAMPEGVDFLIYRREAMEAEVLGFLAKDEITPEWRASLATYDYAKIMNP